MMNSILDPSNFIKYHKALELYLGISQDKLTPITSARVAKAREKLSRLTEIQFYDLSTDVYDELQRRINETNEKPKHLPPQANYHPKRNQARQKLAALPSQRFKDLVNDVLYEIDRRKLAGSSFQDPIDEKDEEDEEANEKKSVESDTPDLNQYHTRFDPKVQMKMPQIQPPKPRAEMTPGEPQPPQLTVSTTTLGDKDDEGSDSSDTTTPLTQMPQKRIETPSQREIKATKVVPKRTELTWSSDEDEDEDVASNPLSAIEERSVLSKKSRNASEMQAKVEQLQSELKRKDEILSSKKNQLDAKESEIKRLNTQLDEMETKLDSAEQKSHKLEDDMADTTSRSLQANSEKATKLANDLRDSEQKCQELENGKQQAEMKNETNEQTISELQAELDQLKEEHSKQQENLGSKYEDLKVKFSSLSQQRYNQDDLVQELQEKVKNLTEFKTNAKKLDDEAQNKHSALLDQYMQLKQQYGTLQQKQQNGTRSLKTGPSQPSTDDGADDTLWRKKYENLRSGNLVKSLQSKSGLDLEDIRRYCNEDGSVPMDAMATFYASVEVMLQYVAETSKVSISGLFRGISEIVSSAHAITREAGSSDPTTAIGQKTQLIESGLSSLLTTTRYYSIYKDVMPQLLMHASINDVYFAVCDLIGLTKIRGPGSNLQKMVTSNENGIRKTINEATNDSKDMLKRKDYNTPDRNANSRGSSLNTGRSPFDALSSGHTVGSNRNVSQIKSLKLDMPPKQAFDGKNTPPRTPTDEETISQVRPLRMAQRLSNPQDEEVKEDKIGGPRKIPNFKSNLSPIGPIPVARPKEISKGSDVRKKLRAEAAKQKKETAKASPKKSLKSPYKGHNDVNTSPTTPTRHTAPPMKAASPIERSATGSLSISPGSHTRSLDVTSSSSTSPLRNNDSFDTESASISPTKPLVTNKPVVSPASKPLFKSSNSVSSLASKFSNGGSQKEVKTPVKPLQHHTPGSLDKLKKQFEHPEHEAKTNSYSSEKPSKVGRMATDSKKLVNPLKPEITDSTSTLDESEMVDASADMNDSRVDAAGPSSKTVSNGMSTTGSATANREMSTENVDAEEGEEEDEDEANFDLENFNTLDPDNTLKELLLYLEHQTVEVISSIQQLLQSIRDPKATRGLLRVAADQMTEVVKQMSEGTNTLMNQSRYADAMGHARYVVDVLDDCVVRMDKLYGKTGTKDEMFADKDFKQRSAGVAFDIARSTKELVKTVEEASLRDEIAVIDSRLQVPEPRQ